MTLKSPNLDDRTFQQLLDEAKVIIKTRCPQWTDLTVGDPGIVILELFAFLTETMIYRLNRLPEKAYVEFLRLIGVKLTPPVAASVKLRFTVSSVQDKPVMIPKGTRVTLGRASGSEPPPVFVVLKPVTIPVGKTQVDAVAYHCDLIEGEDAGKGIGEPGSSVTAQHPPIVAATSDELELVVGVEAPSSEITDRTRARDHEGQGYIIWREVDDFSDLSGRRLVYVADRMAGTISFAPALHLRDDNGHLGPASELLADVPKAGRQIRLWYCSGGGLAGNVAANTLTSLKTPIPGVAVSVTNPEPAAGGRDAETLENALLRGPQELHSLQRAVTARDFELLAIRSSGTVASSGAVARAKAFTQSALWKHAVPGTIEVALVPSIPDKLRPNGRVTEATLKEHETAAALENVQKALDERRPLGTTCFVNWVRYKEVRVEARAVVHRGENAEAVKTRVLKRLHQSINPLPSDLPSAGWPFRQPLRASHVYDIMLAEPGVNFVDNVKLLVDNVPDGKITSLAVDYFQPHTWFASTDEKLFRSMDGGDGWELVERFPDNELTHRIRPNPFKAGQVALITNLVTLTDKQQVIGSRLYVSEDCGESWTKVAETVPSRMQDVAWVPRQPIPVLMIAADEGLFELQAGATPQPILVDASRPKLGFYAITCAVGIRGTIFVAAAAKESAGVFLSLKGGQSKTYNIIGLKGDDIRVLEIRKDKDERNFLWAGITLFGNETAKPGEDGVGGTIRWELVDDTPPGTGTIFRRGWAGGSCKDLAFTRKFAFAASHEKGVLWLDLGKPAEQAVWNQPVLQSGLELRDNKMNFQPTEQVAADPNDNIVMASATSGIYRTTDNGTSYRECSDKEQDKVTLPDTWLFVSGEHKVEVAGDDE